MGYSPVPSRRRALTILFGCIAVLATALALPLVHKTVILRFDTTALEALENEKPDYVFIGNPMVDTRIDPAVFREAGISVYPIRVFPTYVPSWLLVLKNYVAAAKHRPKKSFLFFRDGELTETAFDFHPKYLRAMAPHRRFLEPEFGRMVYAQATRSLFSGAMADIARFYEESASPFRTALFARANETSSNYSYRRQLANEFLSLSGRRPADDGTICADDVRAASKDFRSAPPNSWLPLFIEVARMANLPPWLYRVKRSPQVRRDYAPELGTYIRDLRGYRQSENVCFLDENDETAITDDFFVDPSDDHVASSHRARYSKWFASRHCGGSL